MNENKRTELHKQGYWVDREENIVHVSEMNNERLSAIANWLSRWATKTRRRTLAFYLCCEEPHGDMAQLTFEGECDYLFQSEPSDFLAKHPIFIPMLEELKKRQLSLPTMWAKSLEEQKP